MKSDSMKGKHRVTQGATELRCVLNITPDYHDQGYCSSNTQKTPHPRQAAYSVWLLTANQRRVPDLWSCWTNRRRAEASPVPARKPPLHRLGMSYSKWNQWIMKHPRCPQCPKMKEWIFTLSTVTLYCHTRVFWKKIGQLAAKVNLTCGCVIFFQLQAVIRRIVL